MHAEQQAANARAHQREGRIRCGWWAAVQPAPHHGVQEVHAGHTGRSRGWPHREGAAGEVETRE